MLQHCRIASSGHCVTYPQEINEPAEIFHRLPEEIKIIKVRKQGKTDSSKDFRIRRFFVQDALIWLKSHNHAYSDILFEDRLHNIPLDGESTDI